jgi:hypothetical protein
MANTTAAIWSSIAAIGSALSAFLMLRMQQKSRRDAAKPELILTGWERHSKMIDGTKLEVVNFSTIKNIGNGPAIGIIFMPGTTPEMQRPYELFADPIPILAADEAYSIDGEIQLHWHDVSPPENYEKFISIDIRVFSWCTRNYRYETHYKLMVAENTQALFSDAIHSIEGVSVPMRYTICRPLWGINVLRQLSRFPFVGKRWPNWRR